MKETFLTVWKRASTYDPAQGTPGLWILKIARSKAIDRLESSPLEVILVTNTTPLEEKLARCSKLRPFSVAPLLGEAVRRIHEDSSVSSLFV